MMFTMLRRRGRQSQVVRTFTNLIKQPNFSDGETLYTRAFAPDQLALSHEFAESCIEAGEDDTACRL